MTRLPQPGSDDGQWGTILNDYLSQIHNTDGTLKTGIIAEANLAPAVQTKLNASGSGGSSGVASVNTRTGTVTLTKSDVGLGNVDNTADTDKPISTAAQTALNAITNNPSTLAQAVPGTTFAVIFDGTNWKYAGSTVSARPTARTDLIMECVNPVNTTVPTWAIAGDRLLRVG